MHGTTNPKLANINFAISVRPSVRMEQLGSHWADFHKVLHLKIFRKSIKKIPVLLRLDKKKGYFT